MKITQDQVDSIRSLIATFNSPHGGDEATQTLALKMATASLCDAFPAIVEDYCKDYACTPRQLDMVAEMKKLG